MPLNVELDPRTRQGVKMMTCTGAEVVYLDPSHTRIRGRDLLVHLSNSCRYSGAIKVPILLHLALCTRLGLLLGCTPQTLAYVAAHDLHEAYVGDLPTGLKRVLPGWEKIEDAWEQYVHEQLGLAWPPPHNVKLFVKAIDLVALLVEMRHFQHPCYWEGCERVGREPTREEMMELDTLTDEDPVSWYFTVQQAVNEGGGRMPDYRDGM